MKTTTLAGAALIIALASASSAIAEPARDHVKSGRYLLSVTSSERAARERAIDLAVKEFFVLARPFARSTLESKTKLASWVSVHRFGDKFTVEFEGRPPITGSINAPGSWQSPEGEVFTVEFQLDDSVIVQILRGENGTRINRFHGRPDATLVLEVEVVSQKLNRPLRYSLTYRMKEQGSQRKVNDREETGKGVFP